MFFKISLRAALITDWRRGSLERKEVQRGLSEVLAETRAATTETKQMDSSCTLEREPTRTGSGLNVG